jgi:predicted DNA repair protein MutK
VIEESTLEEEEVNSEKSKISSAIKTDFILFFGDCYHCTGNCYRKEHPLIEQIIVVTIVAFLATVGVYGIVALIVRMDDGFFR